MVMAPKWGSDLIKLVGSFWNPSLTLPPLCIPLGNTNTDPNDYKISVQSIVSGKQSVCTASQNVLDALTLLSLLSLTLHWIYLGIQGLASTYLHMGSQKRLASEKKILSSVPFTGK